MDDWEKFDETLHEREGFKTHLNMENFTDVD